jgi:YD repeat-containing protein
MGWPCGQRDARRAYDAKGRVVSTTDAVGSVTDYVYDTNGNLSTVTAPSNNDAGTRPVTTYGYDALGRVTSVTDPLTHVTTYTYDVLDRVATVTLSSLMLFSKPAGGLVFDLLAFALDGAGIASREAGRRRRERAASRFFPPTALPSWPGLLPLPCPGFAGASTAAPVDAG